MKPITPEQRDGIPREVATAMLTEPRARLTNRMRKNCASARDAVFASTSPIVGQWVSEEDSENDKWMLLYTEREGRSPEDKMKRRFAVATLRQLGNWLRRSIARRRPLQDKFQAIVGDSPRHSLAREIIALAVQRLDTIRDVCEDEIAMRNKKAKQVVAVRRGFGSAFDFLPTPPDGRRYCE